MEAGDTSLADGAGRDPWLDLSRHTAARIALGRSGGSLRTGSLLDFRMSHARARDAVHAAFDGARLVKKIAESGLEAGLLESAASDRGTYLLRPDLGRQLGRASRKELSERAPEWGRRDLVIIISDGLAAEAATNHAPAVASAVAGILGREGWTLYPILVVPFARVKIQDEIGEILGAAHSLILLGERPGLSAPDSLGGYLTFGPKSERSDADRNCVSNIRPEGIPPMEAGAKLAGLLRASRRLGLSGVGLIESEMPSIRKVVL